MAPAAALERDEIFKEYNGLREHIRSYEALLADDRAVLAVVRADRLIVPQRDESQSRSNAMTVEARPSGRIT